MKMKNIALKEPSIITGYTRPAHHYTSATVISAYRSPTHQNHRLGNHAKKRAYATLTQALAPDILHQFSQYKTSYDLWLNMCLRFEGDESMNELKMERLKQAFENFNHMGNESLAQMSARFHHLIAEMERYGQRRSRADYIKQFAGGLPDKWVQYVRLLKETNQLNTLSLAQFVMKLQYYEQEDDMRTSRTNLPQNPSLYRAESPSVTANPHPQTAFTTNNSQPSGSPFIITPTVQGSGPSTSSSSTAKTIQLNLGNVSVEVAQEHMALLGAVITSYNDLVAGQIGNPTLTSEDYDQIDKDEMELMDIQWAFPSVVRRAKNFMERTGRREIGATSNTRYGFDKEKVTCFNCGGTWNFKRECQQPRQQGRQNPFRNTSGPRQNNDRAVIPVNNNNRALMIHDDEGCNWNLQLGIDDGAPGGNGGAACLAKEEDAKEVVNEVAEGVESKTMNEEVCETTAVDKEAESDADDSECSSDSETSSEESVESSEESIDGLLAEADSVDSHNSVLVDSEAEKKDLSEHFTAGSGATHQAMMAITGSSSSSSHALQRIAQQVESLTDCTDCIKLVGKIDNLVNQINALTEHNERLSQEKATLIMHNERLTKSEKQFNSTIENHKKDIDD